MAHQLTQLEDCTFKCRLINLFLFLVIVISCDVFLPLAKTVCALTNYGPRNHILKFVMLTLQLFGLKSTGKCRILAAPAEHQQYRYKFKPFSSVKNMLFDVEHPLYVRVREILK